MKILLISDLYKIIDDNSIPSVLNDFSLALKEFNHEVAVIRPNFLINSIIRKHKILKNGKYKINDIEIYNRNFFLPFLTENKGFIEKFKNFDVIISHLPSGHIYASLINKYLRLKHVSILHQSDYTVLKDIKYSLYFKNRLKNALKNSTLIGARNKFLKDELNAQFILPSFVKKENIVEFKSFNKDKLNIITLSKLIKRKNIDKIILALANVKFDYNFSIYGDGKEKKYLNSLIKKYRLTDKIKIYPYVEHNLINNILDKNDVFILPSENESFGLSYFEALSRGLIVVASKNTGIDGIIEDNKNGFLTNPNVIEIKNVLEKINSLSHAKKQELSSNSLELIKNYTKEKVIKNYLKTIQNTDF